MAVADNSLFPKGRPTDSKEIERAFEQYKLAVDMWDRVRARRQLANTFYLSINSAIVGAIALSPLGFSPHALSIAGIVICTLWTVNILMYGRLADDKRRVIVELEELFPCSPFQAEQGTFGRRFTLIERCIPIAFAVLYMSLTATALWPSR